MEEVNNKNAVAVLNSNLEAANWKEKRESVLKSGESVMQVTNNDELENATKIEKEAKKLVKTLEQKRKELTGPLDEAKKLIMSAEKEEAKALNDLILKLDKLNSAYAVEQARKAEEERRRIEAEERARAEAEAARIEEEERKAREAAAANAAFGFGAAAPAPAPVAPPPPPPMPTVVPTVQKASASSASFTEVWNFEIVDQNAVPRELCSPDEKKIRAVLNAKKAEGYKADQIVIEGIRISVGMQVRSR